MSSITDDLRAEIKIKQDLRKAAVAKGYTVNLEDLNFLYQAYSKSPSGTTPLQVVITNAARLKKDEPCGC